MKLLMSLLLVVSATAFAATDVNLNSKVVNLGNLGDIRKVSDFDTKGEFNLIRSTQTPKKVKLTYAYKAPRMVCVETRTVTYPCGGYYRGRYPRTGYPRPYPPRGGRPYPPRGRVRVYVGNSYPGACIRTECVKYAPKLFTEVKSLKLNFRKANALAGTDKEELLLNLNSNGRSVGYDIHASDYTDIKKRKRSIKFKN